MILDEIHLLGADRGPILEVTLLALTYKLISLLILCQYDMIYHFVHWYTSINMFLLYLFFFVLTLISLSMFSIMGFFVFQVIVSRMRYISSQTERSIRFVGLSTALANARYALKWCFCMQFFFYLYIQHLDNFIELCCVHHSISINFFWLTNRKLSHDS